MRFRNRRDAGRRLAGELKEYAGRPDVIVLALPRGGVPVAFEVARAVPALLDVFLVRKLGVPGHAELAMGAIAAGVELLDEPLIRELGIPSAVVRQVALRERLELDRRDRAYRSGRPAPVVRDRTVILVDDGLATGSTMLAAALALRPQSPACLVVTVPVGSVEAVARLRREADRVVCLHTPEPFTAVGAWYEDFSQTSDGEVGMLLAAADEFVGRPSEEPLRPATE